MGKKLSELVEATVVSGTDIFHLRTSGGIDKKILLDNILGFTTKGDLTIRGTNIPEKLAAGALDTYFKGQGAGVLPIYEKLALRDTGVKIGSFTKSASETFNITDVGFEPSVVIWIAGVSGNPAHNFGFDDAITHYCMWNNYNREGLSFDNDESIFLVTATSTRWRGYISAFLSNGFTVVLTKELAPPNITVMYLALP